MLDPQIFTRTRDSPRLASLHHKWGQGPPKIFKGEHWTFKIWLKIQPITLGLVGVTSQNFWSTNKKVIGINDDPPKWTFSGNYISAGRAAAASNFYTHYKPPKLYFQSDLQHWTAPTWALPHILVYVCFDSNFWLVIRYFLLKLQFVLFYMCHLLAG